MANTIESIPEATRWEIATEGLTGAYIAISNALTRRSRNQTGPGMMPEWASSY